MLGTMSLRIVLNTSTITAPIVMKAFDTDPSAAGIFGTMSVTIVSIPAKMLPNMSPPFAIAGLLNISASARLSAVTAFCTTPVFIANSMAAVAASENDLTNGVNALAISPFRNQMAVVMFSMAVSVVMAARGRFCLNHMVTSWMNCRPVTPSVCG